jgi:CTP:molybdopterin cytidylyltransferase MocA
VKNLCVSAPLRLCVENGGLAGLVLAGGEGSRFGGPKAWALLPDGRTFLEACTVSLRAGGAAPVVATLPPGSDDPQVRGLAVVPLPEPGLDMYASLRIGLQRLAGEEEWASVALLPVDHPLVQSETIAALARSQSAAAIPIHHGKHGHPVVIDRATAEMIASGELPGPTLREVLREIGAVDIEIDDPGAVANCNTPAALAQALAILE